jgi:hypothetical protein
VLFASLLPNVARLVPPLDYLGDVSNGIYLWHLPVILALTAHSMASSPLTLLGWTLAIVIALSALTWPFPGGGRSSDAFIDRPPAKDDVANAVAEPQAPVSRTW